MLLSIKAEHPSWSVRQAIADAVASGHLSAGVRPAHSTVHRLLRAEGLMSKPTAAGDGTDRRRFSYRSAGQLWMSDVMQGACAVHNVAGGRSTLRLRKAMAGKALVDEALAPPWNGAPDRLAQSWTATSTCAARCTICRRSRWA